MRAASAVGGGAAVQGARLAEACGCGLVTGSQTRQGRGGAVRQSRPVQGWARQTGEEVPHRLLDVFKDLLERRLQNRWQLGVDGKVSPDGWVDGREVSASGQAGRKTRAGVSQPTLPQVHSRWCGSAVPLNLPTP